MKYKRKLIPLLMVLAMFMSVLVGCTEKTTTMYDREGNEFVAPKEINKIISTAPSNTEVLMALGLGDRLIAIDKYSTDIEGVNPELPQLDFRNPDVEAIISLKPDMIIASGHNKVGDEDPFALIKQAGIAVVYIPSSYSIDGIYGDIEFMAQITDTELKGKEIVENMKKEVNAIKTISDTITEKKNVYFEIGSGSGLFTFGKDTFLNEMIEVVGAKNIFGDQNSWITTSEESVIAANPDVILTNNLGLSGNEKTAIEDITSREGWNTITAVKNGDVYMVDNNASSRPSQNIIKALKKMAKVIYPDEYKDL
ncbi:ABC transporter substrate-binding protein [Clostridium botulinum]|nr:ABC transporter substrate-binding protein [Clostridium botulinum]